jgi:CRP-like cAMP-binding protein
VREDQSVRSLTRSHLSGSGGVEAVSRSLGPLLERTPNLRSAADAVAETVHHPAAKVLFNKGDSADAFYVLEEGVIEISVISLDGRKLLLEVLRPPAMFGEIGFFSGYRTADAVALTDVRLKRVKRADLFNEIQARPELLLEVIDLLCERLTVVSSKLEERTFLPLDVRIARRVVLLLDSYPEGNNRVPLSQTELANFVGATREGVAKAMAPWRQLGWVEFSRKSIHVLNREALEHLASSVDG